MTSLLAWVKSLNWISVLIGILLGRFVVARFV